MTDEYRSASYRDGSQPPQVACRNHPEDILCKQTSQDGDAARGIRKGTWECTWCHVSYYAEWPSHVDGLPTEQDIRHANLLAQDVS